MGIVVDVWTVSAWFWGIFISPSRQQVCIRVRNVFVILFTACNCNLSSWKSSFCNGAIIYFPWNRAICLNSWARTCCAAEGVWKCSQLLSFHTNALLKNVQKGSLGGWTENYVDVFSSTGLVLKADFLTSAVRFSWGICAAAHVLLDSRFLVCSYLEQVQQKYLSPVQFRVLSFITHTPLWFISTRGMN